MIKYKIYVVFLLFLSICAFGFVRASDNDLPLLGKVIYIDAGHGGIDPGAVYKDIHEADINLKISMSLANLLEKNGAIVLLTRTGDYDLSVNNAVNRKRSNLSRRANIINESNGDLYISIHLNSIASSTWKGAQVFYDDINPKNEKIAKLLQNALKKDLKSSREYKEMNNMYMYKRIKIPGVLVEVGFLSNDNERYLLLQKTYQDKVAKSLCGGIIEYFHS